MTNGFSFTGIEPGVPVFSESLQDAAATGPFIGITSDGNLIPDLYPLTSTGVSTQPILDAANAYLASLNFHQRRKSIHPIDSDEWRYWNNTSNNQHRSGLMFFEMSNEVRERAFDLMRASLSSYAFETSRDVMRLNETIAEMTGRFDHYGEYVYWLTIFGEPSPDKPWGWQMDGHHLIVNFFVLGDQVVLSPVFVGTEPVLAPIGKYKGLRAFKEEEDVGLDMVASLNPVQLEKTVVSTQCARECLTAAFRDNEVVPYEGLSFSEMLPGQQELLMRIVDRWVGYLRPEHASLRLDEVKRHLDSTYFTWMGHPEDRDAPFYYRVQSPVLVIELDHLPPIAMRDPSVHEYEYYARPGQKPVTGQKPYRDHVHAMLRTPNGNDYGKDYLRQHYLQHDHVSPASTHL